MLDVYVWNDEVKVYLGATDAVLAFSTYDAVAAYDELNA
jgi:hypothetical protein